MTTNEEQRLKEAILILSDRTRDRQKGWAMLCGLAGVDPAKLPNPFQEPAGPNPKHQPEDYAD